MVCFNENGRLVDCATEAEFTLMYGKGSMIKLVSAESVATNTRNITVDDLYGHIGIGSILRFTLDFEAGSDSMRSLMSTSRRSESVIGAI